MSTNSTIWIKNSDDTFTGIYCHWDGHIETNGKTLKEHYNSEEKIRDLLFLGHISSLGESVECPEGHSFSNSVDGYTVAYHRDRGDDFDQYESSTEKFEEYQEYNYLFKDGEWYVSEYDGEFNLLQID